MKVCGFSIIRNAIKYDYPIKEAILSILPLCDAFYIGVGLSDDDTLAMIKGIESSKIVIIETVWDDGLRQGGRVLAAETNKVFEAIPLDYDWCFYIQADEVVHEKYHDAIRSAMHVALPNMAVNGLLFDYTHFYGSYATVADSRKWYRHEIRVVRNNKAIVSWKDAQGFRFNDQKIVVLRAHASVYHYGWVKHPEVMQTKMSQFQRLWHNDDWIAANVANKVLYDYHEIDSCTAFKGTHPAVMAPRIAAQSWTFDLEKIKLRRKPKEWLLYQLERLTGHRFFEYKNYRLLK